MPTPPPPAKRLDSHGKPVTRPSSDTGGDAEAGGEEDDASSVWSSDEEGEGGEAGDEGAAASPAGLEGLRVQLESAKKRTKKAEAARARKTEEGEALQAEVSTLKAQWASVKSQAEACRAAETAATEAATKYSLALKLAETEKTAAVTERQRVEVVAQQKHEQVAALSRQLAQLARERRELEEAKDALAVDNRKYRTKIGHMELASKRPKGAHKGEQYDVDGNLVSNEITFKVRVGGKGVRGGGHAAPPSGGVVTRSLPLCLSPPPLRSSSC